MQFYTERICSFYAASVPAGFVPTAVPVVPSPRCFPHLPWERLGRKGCDSHVSVLARGKVGQ